MVATFALLHDFGTDAFENGTACKAVGTLSGESEYLRGGTLDDIADSLPPGATITGIQTGAGLTAEGTHYAAYDPATGLWTHFTRSNATEVVAAVKTLTFSGTPDITGAKDHIEVFYNDDETPIYDEDCTSDTLNTEVGAIRDALTTLLAAEPVTVGGSNAVITLTMDDGEALADISVTITLAQGDFACVETDNLANLDMSTDIRKIPIAVHYTTER